MTEDQGWRRSFERDQDVINEAGIARVREALAAALNTNPQKYPKPREHATTAAKAGGPTQGDVA